MNVLETDRDGQFLIGDLPKTMVTAWDFESKLIVDLSKHKNYITDFTDIQITTIGCQVSYIYKISLFFPVYIRVSGI